MVGINVLRAAAGPKEHIVDWVEEQMVLKEGESGSWALRSLITQQVYKNIKTIPDHILMTD